MRVYPMRKVIVAFSLVPAWGGLCMGSITLFMSSTPFGPKGETFAGQLLYQFFVLLLPMCTVLLVDVVPAALLGVLYALLKLQRGLMSYVLVFLCGGSVAYSWTEYLLGWLGEPHPFAEFETIRRFMFQNMPAKALVLGAVFSVVTAMVVLPSSKGQCPSQ